MTIHDIISNKLVLIFKNMSFMFPENFIYLQYYFIYTFLYYITKKNIILYSLSLHSVYICELIFNNLSTLNNYKRINNAFFLINTSYLLFIYLFFFKIFFLKIYFYYKMLFLLSSTTFYSLMTINNIYSKRLECINMNQDFYHPLKILIINPNKKFIQNIINKTKFFTYSNFLIFINIFFVFIY